MSTTPTLREAAQAVLANEGAVFIDQRLLDDLRAALTQAADAGAAEPVAVIANHSSAHRTKPIGNRCDALPLGTKLYTAPPAQQLQQAVARALADLKFHPQASHVEPNYRDWFNKTIDAAIRQQGTP